MAYLLRTRPELQYEGQKYSVCNLFMMSLQLLLQTRKKRRRKDLSVANSPAARARTSSHGTPPSTVTPRPTSTQHPRPNQVRGFGEPERRFLRAATLQDINHFPIAHRGGEHTHSDHHDRPANPTIRTHPTPYAFNPSSERRIQLSSRSSTLSHAHTHTHTYSTTTTTMSRALRTSAMLALRGASFSLPGELSSSPPASAALPPLL